MRSFNLKRAKFEYDAEDPEGFRSGMDRFGSQVGAKMLGGSVYELPPGQSVCPYHYEYGNEEWVIVLPGAPRFDTRRVRRNSRPTTSSASPRAPRARTS